MLAQLNLDQWCDVTTVTPDLQPLVEYKFVRGEPQAFYPKGAIFSGPIALQLCRNGQATPIDEEATKALGLTPSQIAAASLEYEMTAKGVHDKKDRDLFRAGVIAGYDDDLKPIPGPNWDKYQAALKADEDKE